MAFSLVSTPHLLRVSPAESGCNQDENIMEAYEFLDFPI